MNLFVVFVAIIVVNILIMKKLTQMSVMIVKKLTEVMKNKVKNICICKIFYLSLFKINK